MAVPVVRRPVMLQSWRDVSFLHWRADAKLVQHLLPEGLTAETHDGHAWIGLVQFFVHGVRRPPIPALPWLSSFPQTNLRTYVRGPDGAAGVWFFSLDAGRLAAVLGARASFHLPFCWSSMRVERQEERIWYSLRRRWPAGEARAEILVEVGEPLEKPGPRELFLAMRYRLYATHGRRLSVAEIEHTPWPLYRAHAPHIEESVLRASRIIVHDAPAVVHYSPGVDARIGPLRSVT